MPPKFCITYCLKMLLGKCKKKKKNPTPKKKKKKKILGLQRDLNPWSLRKCYVQRSTN